MGINDEINIFELKSTSKEGPFQKTCGAFIDMSGIYQGDFFVYYEISVYFSIYIMGNGYLEYALAYLGNKSSGDLFHLLS